MPAPLNKSRKIKKRSKPFLRLQTDRFNRVPENWRRPKGIDCNMRRKKSGKRPLVSIGYGTNKKQRFLRPNNFYTFVIHNVDELEALMMQNRRYCAEIAHSVSVAKRQSIIERAEQLDILITNPNARIRTEE
eukprot:TRINITY_DN13440_c0_g1_i1.p1 TRINITY_DN13440_c0_g1~~TRINITY_DN13440_c0_g1_i1.p1  ORF type:complete len:132 (-),score=34.20 TRINITY_DN13440_c0_g1_i1:46-441(-)